MAEFRAGQILTAEALNAVFGDSGILALPVTAGTGWSVTTAQYRLIGKLLDLYVEIARTGADVTGSAGGNISPDLVICTITDPALRPIAKRVPGYRANVTSGGCDISPVTGEITIVDMNSGANILTGATVQVSDFYTIP